MKQNLIALAVFGLPLAAFAADEPMLGEIIVTAARLPQSIDRVLNDVTVINREDIDRSGQASLTELMQTLPGVEITQSGGIGSVSSVFLRGGNGGHALVLVDGVRVTSATLGSTRLEHIPLGLVERIEVVRGPMSHLYGSEAISGVIQIFTRRPTEKPQYGAAVGIGSYGREDVAAYAGGVNENGWRYSLAGSYKQLDGFNAKKGDYPDRDGYRSHSASFHLERDVTAGHTLMAQGMATQARTQFDNGVTPFDNHSDVQMGNVGVGLKSQIGGSWSSTLRVNLANEDIKSYRYLDAGWWGPGGPSNSHITMNQREYGWQLDGQAGLGDLQLLAERIEQEVGGDVGYDKKLRSRNALMLGWRRELGRHDLAVNVRRDEDSQFGGENTGVASYGYRLNDAWRAVAAYGTAFKAPSFDDLYWPGQGNPNLRPETSRNLELGLRYRQGGREFGATAYENKVRDLIQWADSGVDLDGDGWTDWLPSNVAAARLRGLTLTWRERLGSFALRANLDIQNPENTDTGKLLLLRSRHHGSMGVDWVGGAWTASADLIGQGKRYSDQGNTEKLSGYWLLNLGLGYQLAQEWKIEARLANAFDRDYELAEGYNTPGRNIFVQLRYVPR
ncbi:MAG: TonB-dependent receptor [Hydrogenophilaceae bacterium]|nr:TonB-dependent receptor [Hydrogenophilaceae bacterium]